MIPGIYSLDDDRLKLCIGKPEERPIGFLRGSATAVLFLKRDTSKAVQARFQDGRVLREIQQECGSASFLNTSFGNSIFISLRAGQGDGDLARLVPYLRRFSHITGLHVHNTRVTDRGLAFLEGLDTIGHLNLESTAISDAGLAHLRNMSHLKFLIVTGTRVTDAVVADLKRFLPKLEIENLTPTQQISENAIINAGGILLSSGGRVREIRFITSALSDAQLGDLKAPLEIWKANLASLDLSGAKITDRGLDSLRGLSELKGLSLAGTAVTDEGVKSLAAALPNLQIQR